MGTQTGMVSLSKELIPDRIVRIPLSWLISIGFLLVSLSVGYGGYRAGYQNQAAEIDEAKHEIAQLHDVVSDLKIEMGELKQSMEDLRDSLDRKH